VSIEWASGEVAAARHAAVSSRVLARIEDVRVAAGSRVEEGDVLVVLDARDLRARLGEADETLRAARARRELAESEFARVEALFRGGVAAQRQLDEATSELRSARAAVKALEQAREEARAALSFAELRAPVRGRVVDRLAEPGDTAIPGQPLLRIYDPTLLRIEVPVRESLAVRLRVGQPLRIEIPALGESLEGAVDEMVPFAEPGARTMLVKVRIVEADDRLIAGMFARVAIPAGKRRRLLVPSRAIVEIGQLRYVDAVDESGARARRIVTTGGEAPGDRTEILSGLRPGELVWVPGSNAQAEDARRRAGAAVGAFRQALVQALQSALQESPMAAIDVCRLEAPRIAERVSVDGVAVGRTSHRLRNPSNAPEDWMLPFLREFRTSDAAAGSSRTFDLGGRLGYVEPIYVQELCVTCHGSSVEPSLLEHIRERYPEDAAVGFEVGDFRGLFWAVVGAPTGPEQGAAARQREETGASPPLTSP
jgi:RND family efflux transporter MFP subunit